MHAPLRLLHETLLKTATDMPTKTAVVFGDHSYDYAALLQQSMAVAQALRALGIRRGDRVAIMLDNSWESLTSLYGCLNLGAVFVMVNPQTKSDKLAYLLEHSGARVLIAQSNLQKVCSTSVEKLPNLNLVLVNAEGSPSKPNWTAWPDFLDGGVKAQQREPIIANDLAAIIYTSGSTGKPKGVVHTHQSMVFALNSLIEYLRLSADDKILCALPLTFDYGLYQALMTVALGATLVLEKSFAYPAVVYDRMLNEQVTVFPGVPTMFAMLATANRRSKLEFPTVTRVTNTAAALLSSAVPGVQQIFPNALIFKMYGLTECKRVCYLPPEQLQSHPDSVGIAIPGTEVYLKTDDGRKITSSGEGILHVRGPHLMTGYWNDAVATDKMLVAGDLANEKHLCTHDLFRMDEQGYLYFLGRTDDMIKSRGEKVAPLEVEDVLLKIDGVREAAVVGIADETLGEVVCAFVSLHADTSLNEKQLRKACLTRLENYMIPGKFVLLPELPKSDNGKIDKLSLKAQN